MPELSIVLGCLDRTETFDKLYKSVEEHTQDVDWEMVVSDASMYTPLIAANYPRAIIIPERPRRGHSFGYNCAFRAAKGEYVVWLNDDAEVTPHWARNAIEFMKNNPHVGMGALYYCVHGEPYFCNSYVGLPYANFGIINREFGNKIGWFDEDVRMYGADNSIAFRVYLNDKIVAGIRDARVIHKPYMDQHRAENEARQEYDATILMTKYRPMLDQMQETFKKYKDIPLK